MTRRPATALAVGLIVIVTVAAIVAIRLVAANSKATPAAGQTTQAIDRGTVSAPGPSDPAPSVRDNTSHPPLAATHSPLAHPHSGSITEQEWHTGANTFSDPRNASGLGPKIAAGQYVRVSCRLHDPSIASANPGGYWYRIASPPWNNQYYAVANTFLNGDPWNGPYTHPTDLSVPTC
jgi:hypothetical protein